ncbi:MAG: hypothetical protein QM760_23405 [Nibricoccus sp.]
MIRLSHPTSAAILMSLAAARALAVYAPIPEQEQGKLLTIYASGGAYYDTNIFGAPTDELASMVYQVSPRFVFNMSASDQTLVSASYQLSLDYFADRPGEQLLDSHSASASIKHTFSPRLEAEISDSFQLSKNPESLLPGLSTVLNTDQSYALNQLDGRLAANLTKRTGLTFKARTATFAYDNDSLAEELDRSEYLGGLALTHTLLPEIQAVAEYRHQTIRYASGGESKDKDSDFALIGADYVVNPRMALSGRVGSEYRRRKGADDEILPYTELALKLDYGKGSYLSAGYGFSVEEVSNLDVYTDMSVHRFFANVQQVISPRMVATASLGWEPGTLNGRAGVSPDRDETNTKVGLALIYRLNARWTASATLDYDNVNSEDPGRMLQRTRGGLSVRCVF